MVLDELQEKSNQVFYKWSGGVPGWAPEEVTEKLEVARIDWLIDLTNSLSIWYEKGPSMTDGELILAYVNLGALVEGWLKLFYCIYYLDYVNNPKEDNKGNIIEPNDLGLEKLKQFSRGILWETSSDVDLWVEKIQQRRNAIHSFNSREIGIPQEFLKDIDTFYKFIQKIDDQLPPSCGW